MTDVALTVNSEDDVVFFAVQLVLKRGDAVQAPRILTETCKCLLPLQVSGLINSMVKDGETKIQEKESEIATSRLESAKTKVSSLFDVQKTERKLDTVGLKYLEQNEPDIYRIMVRCIETKPAKTAVTIKRNEA